MVFADMPLLDMVRLYSTLVEGTTESESIVLFDMLQTEANRIQPGVIAEYLTAYDAFLLVEKLSPPANVTPLDVEGYFAPDIDFFAWDPNVPADDTDQYPDDDCTIHRNALEPTNASQQLN